MSIASEISRLQTAKADIKAVLEGKGIPVSSTLKIDGYAELIDLYLVLNTTKVVARYNVTKTSRATPLCNRSAVNQFSEIEIDGVVQPSVVSSYTFSTTGIHIVWFTLSNPTSIGSTMFSNCTDLTSVTIPNGVTAIGMQAFNYCFRLTSITIPNSVKNIRNQAFMDCSGLTSVTIPNSVTSIGVGAFYGCSKLTSITCNATTAPTIQDYTFENIKTGGTLTVPSGSTGYDTWMQNADCYLGKYGWTKVEQ